MMRAASTPGRLSPSFHNRATPPLIMACRLRGDDVGIRCVPRVFVVCVNFTSVRSAHPTPICANPLAAAANPVFRPQRMFHVASKKVPLPPDPRGRRRSRHRRR
jgi:hypothetical protein